jgi:hypothetical protein
MENVRRALLAIQACISSWQARIVGKNTSSFRRDRSYEPAHLSNCVRASRLIVARDDAGGPLVGASEATDAATDAAEF